MNLNKYLTIYAACCLPIIFILVSCGNKYESPTVCVNTFIKSAVEHDMARAWSTLSPEAQVFYNELGIKNRKSGRGILEHDINEVKKFRESKSGYTIETMINNPSKLILKVSGGDTFIIETMDIDGSYKIKDAESVRNVIKGIALEIVKKEYY